MKWHRAPLPHGSPPGPAQSHQGQNQHNGNFQKRHRQNLPTQNITIQLNLTLNLSSNPTSFHTNSNTADSLVQLVNGLTQLRGQLGQGEPQSVSTQVSGESGNVVGNLPTQVSGGNSHAIGHLTYRQRRTHARVQAFQARMKKQNEERELKRKQEEHDALMMEKFEGVSDIYEEHPPEVSEDKLRPPKKKSKYASTGANAAVETTSHHTYEDVFQAPPPVMSSTSSASGIPDNLSLTVVSSPAAISNRATTYAPLRLQNPSLRSLPTKPTLSAFRPPSIVTGATSSQAPSRLQDVSPRGPTTRSTFDTYLSHTSDQVRELDLANFLSEEPLAKPPFSNLPSSGLLGSFAMDLLPKSVQNFTGNGPPITLSLGEIAPSSPKPVQVTRDKSMRYTPSRGLEQSPEPNSIGMHNCSTLHNQLPANKEVLCTDVDGHLSQSPLTISPHYDGASEIQSIDSEVITAAASLAQQLFIQGKQETSIDQGEHDPIATWNSHTPRLPEFLSEFDGLLPLSDIIGTTSLLTTFLYENLPFE